MYKASILWLFAVKTSYFGLLQFLFYIILITSGKQTERISILNTDILFARWGILPSELFGGILLVQIVLVLLATLTY